MVKSASNDGIVTVDLKIRGTFLRAMDDFPYYGPYDSFTYDENLEVNVLTHTNFRVEQPTMIDLQTEGFNEGDKIYISWLGGFYPDGAWNPNNPGSIGYGLRENDDVTHGGLLGLFSTSSQLLDIDQLNRVPGAIDYGDDYSTPDTWWQDGRPELATKLAAKGVNWYTGAMQTDIAEDFKIFPYTGMKVEIPRNAKFLFLSVIDPYYRDNYEGPKGLVVTIEKDTDEDGIPDHWEINGIDIDNDGIIDLDLPMLEADWEHKDIFVEVDWGGFGGVNTAPNFDALDLVEESFAKAPVSNPDNVNGINLHILRSEGVGTGPEKISWNEFYDIKNEKFGDPDERNNANLIKAKKQVFHYCLFANKQVDGSSGRGEVFGNAFLVTLRDNLNENKVSGTFMHELGHNLGLRHGGDERLNYKPNYVSVMNYAFQLDSYGTGRALDFSHGKNPSLDEASLDENVGIGNAVKTVWSLSNGSLCISDATLPIDWNLDGEITANVQENLNNFPPEPNANGNEMLRDHNDWANLFYRFRGTKGFASGAKQDTHVELTLDQISAMEDEAKNIIEVSVSESNVHSDDVGFFDFKKGDWFEYSASHTGNYPNDLSKRFRMKLEEIDGTKISISAEGQNLDEKEWSISETYDLNTGFHDLILIPSGLEVGDQFYHEAFGNIDIMYIETYSYAGEERTVVGSTFSGNTFHWDQDTGVLCQADWNYSPDYETRWILDKTNLWGQTEIDPIVIAGLGIAIIGLLLIVILFFRRKKKKDEKNSKNFLGNKA
ncbi:MAG: hypothetical protein P8Y18_07140 [Candidatus Bathyarchaeota archaeon]